MVFNESPNANKPPLAITPGEPAGIGPDLLLALVQTPRTAPLVAIADVDLLRARASQLGLSIDIEDDLDNPTIAPGRLTVCHVPVVSPVHPGVLDVRNAPYVLETLEIAATGCLTGNYLSLVTGPVQKSIINDAGIPFTGHTEFLRDHAQVADVVMLLIADELRVGLATTHLPLREVATALTRELLERRLTLFLDGLRERFQFSAPRVLVAGLNPHAGEGGHLGREEIEIITPVCDDLRARGEQLIGPLPADTLFTPAVLETGDAVFAMFHDQGLPVLKHAGFGQAVNVTLGLPFLRTSVDHGTALDLAGSGRADPGSFKAAVALAERLSVAPARKM
ncbi:MAG: 4-hydroxythreonine-4-phosphate dehydrogenase PdxA [Gammaproteobacteria bacterium]|nr:4-hydroxythreonine-4-phosphate dehydrogenase PdxA [Gammaproteobacteria bacterium]